LYAIKICKRWEELGDGSESREFNVDFVSSRQHAMYCETGIKFEEMKGLASEFEIFNVAAGTKMEFNDGFVVGQYSGVFKLMPDQPIEFYKDICRIYSQSMDEILLKEFKISLIERLRGSVMVPSGKACTIPFDSAEYRNEHGLQPEENFDFNRAAHDDPSCEHVLGFGELLTGSYRIGRCISSGDTPYGHCERRSKQEALCNIYRLPDNSLTTDRNQKGASRKFPFDFPDCDEAAGLKCQRLPYKESRRKFRPIFQNLAGASFLLAALNGADAQVGICR
jgi:hypothetical protein